MSYVPVEGVDKLDESQSMTYLMPENLGHQESFWNALHKGEGNTWQKTITCWRYYGCSIQEQK